MLAGLFVTASAQWGCSPCAGTSECRTDARVAYTGRMIERSTERGVGGVQLTFVRTGGVELAQDSITTTSDGDGFFTFAVDADAEGEVVGTLSVTPAAPRQPYTVSGIRLRTTTVHGDGGELGRLVIDPYVALVGELRDRRTGAIMDLSDVMFIRTGGVATPSDTIRTRADAFGRFLLTAPVSALGPLTGILVVSNGNYPRPFIYPIGIGAQYLDRAEPTTMLFRLGATLASFGEVYRRGNDARTAGLVVEFDRTGGITVQPSHFETRTNEFGRFVLSPAPDSDGEVVGDLTIRVPAPNPPIIVRSLRVRTHDDDSLRFAGRWGYGQQVLGAIEFWNRTTQRAFGAGGVVTYRRTSGIRTDPETFVDPINSFGRSRIQMAALDSGDVVIDIDVRLGEPYGTETIRGVRFTSRNSDEQILLGPRSVGRWFPQFGIVRDRDTDQPITGAQISFRRTAGIAIQPDPFSIAVNADGSFPIRPQPLGDGEVVGDLTISPPAPYRDTVITGLRLQTSMDDTLRFIGVWRLLRPR